MRMREYTLVNSPEQDRVSIDLSQVGFIKSYKRTQDSVKGPQFERVKVSYAMIGIDGTIFMVDEHYDIVKRDVDEAKGEPDDGR